MLNGSYSEGICSVVTLKSEFPGFVRIISDKIKDNVPGNFGTFSLYLPIRAGIAQLARASAFQVEGRGFESRFPLHFILYCRCFVF